MTEYVPGVYLYDMKARLAEFDPTLAFRLDSQGFVCIVRRSRCLLRVTVEPQIVIYAERDTHHHIMRLTDLEGNPRPPDARDLCRLREIDTWSHTRHIERMDARNASRRRSADRRISDIGYEMGKDIHWHLKKAGEIH